MSELTALRKPKIILVSYTKKFEDRLYEMFGARFQVLKAMDVSMLGPNEEGAYIMLYVKDQGHICVYMWMRDQLDKEPLYIEGRCSKFEEIRTLELWARRIGIDREALLAELRDCMPC